MNQEFLSLIAEADDFTKQVLKENMIKNVMFWGNKAADRLHDLEDKLNAANGDAKPYWFIEKLEEQVDEAKEKLLLLRKMWKTLKA
jgi:hypothetical protein